MDWKLIGVPILCALLGVGISALFFLLKFYRDVATQNQVKETVKESEARLEKRLDNIEKVVAEIRDMVIRMEERTDYRRPAAK